MTESDWRAELPLTHSRHCSWHRLGCEGLWTFCGCYHSVCTLVYPDGVSTGSVRSGGLTGFMCHRGERRFLKWLLTPKAADPAGSFRTTNHGAWEDSESEEAAIHVPHTTWSWEGWNEPWFPPAGISARWAKEASRLKGSVLFWNLLPEGLLEAAEVSCRRPQWACVWRELHLLLLGSAFCLYDFIISSILAG